MLAPSRGKAIVALIVAVALAAILRQRAAAGNADVTRIDNGTASIGVDRTMGGAITWLAWKAHPQNVVNIHDPGRLIQQSYYAGNSLDRMAQGQPKAWSPWPWNPIQAGGVGSWARITKLGKTRDGIFCETIPKLWDMPNEEAAAVMRQWTGFEPGMPNVIVVRCEFESRRKLNDRWGDARVPRHQELPACYFTRSFGAVESYLGSGKWRSEKQPSGPPWGRVTPPRNVVTCFDTAGQGIAVYSPVTTGHWNFGPHGEGVSADPRAGPCMHVAPVETVPLGPQSRVRFRYWLVVGPKAAIVPRLEALEKKYSDEQIELTNGKEGMSVRSK